MTRFVIALPSEAKPLIAHYNLKKIQNSSPYELFVSPSAPSKNEMALIISNIGKLNSAAATAYLAALFPQTSFPSSIWINIGIAGARDIIPGTSFLAHKIIDQSTGKAWYPQHLFDTQPFAQTQTLLTVDQPESKFDTVSIYDMEASGFISAASRFSSLELTHSYKIISDNKESGVRHLTPKKVSSLIESHIDSISHYVDSLEQLHSTTFSTVSNFLNNALKNCSKKWKFSVTQHHRLERLLQRHFLLNENNNNLLLEIENCRSASEVLKTLTGLLEKKSISF